MQALEQIYANAHDGQGKKVFPGLAPGSELGWKAMSAVQVSFAQTFYRDLVFEDPNWNYPTMHFGDDVAVADRVLGGITNSIDANLGPFRDHGGKLLQYHGWSDPLISPYNSVDYYESVLSRLGGGHDHATALRGVAHSARALP